MVLNTIPGQLFPDLSGQGLRIFHYKRKSNFLKSKKEKLEENFDISLGNPKTKIFMATDSKTSLGERKKPCIVGRYKAFHERFGSPYEIRTRITTVKGWCPNP